MKKFKNYLTFLLLSFVSMFKQHELQFDNATGDDLPLSRGQIRSMERAAFDSFDGFDEDMFDPNMFDPDNATGQMKKPVRKTSGVAQFTIKIVNGLGVDTTIELFNYLNSIVWAKNTGVSLFNPWSASSVAAANANSLIYFDQVGSLIFQDAAGLKLTISCNQVPYYSLFIASAFIPFRVTKMLMSFTVDPTLDQDIKHVTNTFLGGKKQNPITPRTFFDPTQFQSKLVTIAAPYDIDVEKGLQMTVLAAETNLSLNLYLARYIKPQI